MQSVCLILTRWIVIYPVDSAIQRLNDRSQIKDYPVGKNMYKESQQFIATIHWIEIYLLRVIKHLNNQALQIISQRHQNCAFEVQLALNLAEKYFNCLFL